MANEIFKITVSFIYITFFPSRFTFVTLLSNIAMNLMFMSDGPTALNYINLHLSAITLITLRDEANNSDYLIRNGICLVRCSHCVIVRVMGFQGSFIHMGTAFANEAI